MSITMIYTPALNLTAGVDSVNQHGRSRMIVARHRWAGSPLVALLNQTPEGRMRVVLGLLGLQTPTAGIGTVPNSTDDNCLDLNWTVRNRSLATGSLQSIIDFPEFNKVVVDRVLAQSVFHASGAAWALSATKVSPMATKAG